MARPVSAVKFIENPNQPLPVVFGFRRFTRAGPTRDEVKTPSKNQTSAMTATRTAAAFLTCREKPEELWVGAGCGVRAAIYSVGKTNRG